MRRQNLVVWSSSGRYASPARSRRAQARGFRRRVRTGALLAAFGLILLARIARTRWRGTLGLSGGVLVAAGITLSTAGALLPGLVILLVTLLLPADPGRDGGLPRRWAEPCLPFFTSARRPGE